MVWGAHVIDLDQIDFDAKTEHVDGDGMPCDCDMERVDCWCCGGEGEFDEHDSDPVNYSPGEEFEVCSECAGRGFFLLCWNRNAVTP